MHLPPSPDSRELLPPLLACLPTAFISPRPPPALLPLLSPLLRQRLSYLASGSNSRTDSWLPLLSWNAERGAQLPAIVERMPLEPHPVSGELEIEDVRPAKYRRLDEETLHARLDSEQFEVSPIYLWCENDEHGGLGPGWRLAELRSLEDADDQTEEWFDTISQANDAAPEPIAEPIIQGTNGGSKTAPSQKTEDDDDDDYWAAYDRTPGRTPAQKNSPAPQSLSSFQPSARRQQQQQGENDYFARYGNEVQPAMDAHDPDEEAAAQSAGLNGSSQPRALPTEPTTTSIDRPESRPTGASLYPANPPTTTAAFPALANNIAIPAPRPISPTSSHSSIEKLEARARAISDAQASDDRAQVAIKQHISTDIKSLFRLARNTGMEREDFEEIVKKELLCLGMLEMEQDR